MTSPGRVLVAGATGQLGNVIARKLLERSVPVRALSRSLNNRSPLVELGAEIAPVDLLNLKAVTDACRGVDQIVATVNNNMGSGPTSPGRVDLTAYQNLCAAARTTGVKRLMYVSYRGIEPDAPVDIFRIKWYVEDAIRRSGVPYVMLRPTAFMDVWIDMLLAPGIRKDGVATIFGSGKTVTNYIAVDDVAEFAVRILARPDVVNENIEVGGPSDATMNDIATLVERQFGVTAKRRHVPVIMMKVLPVLLKPFKEVPARMMTLGHYSATRPSPFPGWRVPAERFGVDPLTVEAYVSRMK